MVDPYKPNHFSHDSLGDPDACIGDHNHPPRLVARYSDPNPRVKVAVEVTSYFVLFAVAFLFFLGVFVLADLVF